ncbi:MAG: MFS transporter [Chloroflexota bacterium]|nr:MAG: MFS transporter [Chloroflexota bacterium]
MVFSLAIFIAAATDNLTIPLILFMTVLIGLWRSIDMIVRQSILPEVVGSQRLQNGVALTRTGRDITQIFAPVLAGILMDAYGITLSYLVIVVLYAISLILITFLRDISRYSTENRDSVLRNLMGGLKYVKAENFLLALLVIAFIVNLTAFPFNNSLIAVVARDVFDTSATGLGWLMGAYSLGALLGSLVVGSFVSSRPTNKLMIAGSFLWHIAILLMAGIKLFYASLPVLMFIGIFQSLSMVTMAVMILQYTGYQMRGRVLGLRQLAVYGLPVGLLLSGFVADEIGVIWALVLNGTMGIALLGGVLFKWPQVLAHDFK